MTTRRPFVSEREAARLKKREAVEAQHPILKRINAHAAWQIRDLRARIGADDVRAYLDALDALEAEDDRHRSW